MATRKKTNKKPGKGNRIAMSLLAALLLALVIVAGFGMVNANLLRIRKAEVVISNLPEHFDGTTLLFASDIDLCGLNTPDHAGEVFNQLQSLHPDALILGGDYNSTSLLDKLNRPEGNNDDEAKKLVARSDFFHYINAFQAPLGKYAIASTEDTQWQNLRQVMEENGVKPLINEKYGLHIGDDTLWLVGISGKVSRLDSVATAFSKDDCVVVIAEGPDVLPVLLTSEASDNGSWIDLVLCGHTHGGQIRLLGRNVLSLSEAEQRFRSGWNTQSGTPILTSEGLGSEGINLRIGTVPEVWLITLRKA